MKSLHAWQSSSKHRNENSHKIKKETWRKTTSFVSLSVSLFARFFCSRYIKLSLHLPQKNNILPNGEIAKRSKKSSSNNSRGRGSGSDSDSDSVNVTNLFHTDVAVDAATSTRLLASWTFKRFIYPRNERQSHEHELQHEHTSPNTQQHEHTKQTAQSNDRDRGRGRAGDSGSSSSSRKMYFRFFNASAAN